MFDAACKGINGCAVFSEVRVYREIEQSAEMYFQEILRKPLVRFQLSVIRTRVVEAVLDLR